MMRREARVFGFVVWYQSESEIWPQVNGNWCSVHGDGWDLQTPGPAETKGRLWPDKLSAGSTVTVEGDGVGMGC